MRQRIPNTRQIPISPSCQKKSVTSAAKHSHSNFAIAHFAIMNPLVKQSRSIFLIEFLLEQSVFQFFRIPLDFCCEREPIQFSTRIFTTAERLNNDCQVKSASLEIYFCFKKTFFSPATHLKNTFSNIIRISLFYNVAAKTKIFHQQNEIQSIPCENLIWKSSCTHIPRCDTSPD